MLIAVLFLLKISKYCIVMSLQSCDCVHCGTRRVRGCMEDIVKTVGPFHESVIWMIESSSMSRLVALGQMIVATKIPKNHDGILAAWHARMQYHGYGLPDPSGVPEHLAAEKARVELEAQKETVEVELGELEAGDEILLMSVRCMLVKTSIIKMLVAMSGPLRGHSVSKMPRLDEKVQKFVKKSQGTAGHIAHSSTEPPDGY